MDISRLLLQIKSKTKRQEPCQPLLVRHPPRSHPPSVVPIKNGSIHTAMEALLFKKTVLDTKRVSRIRSGCRLTDHPYAVRDLVPPSALVVDQHGREWVRMFHGARSQHLVRILKEGIQPHGRGVLGSGFYMTPSLEKALVYTSKSQQQQSLHATVPIVLELFVPIDWTVCCVDRKDRSSCCTGGQLYTEYDELWQFVCKDRTDLQRIRYHVWLL